MTWWGRLLRSGKLERDLDAELRDHIERLTADYMRAGMSEAEARRRARLEFGGEERVKEDCRDARGTRWAETIVQDVRYGVRVLWHSPTFAAAAILSLALGIGANAAIFSLVNSLLLRALPVREPERLVLLEGGSWTNPIWEQVRERQNTLFDGAVAWGGETFDLASGGPSEPADGFWASGDFFRVLGVPTVMGRTFGPEDDRRGGGPNGPVAVISYRFWQSRFSGAADIVGRTLMLDRVAFTIVGVTDPDFVGPVVGQAFDVAVPLGTEPLIRGKESWLDGRSTWWMDIMARLKPGQTVDDATKALRAVQPQIRQATLPDWQEPNLKQYLGDPLSLVPAAGGAPQFRDRYREPLLIIMGTVGLVLLIACANIANLMLARANARRHELGLRLAMGASQLRIARQLFTESLLLSAVGAALGLLLAIWGSHLLVAQLTTVREAVFLDLSLDWRVLGFTALIAVGTALLFGTVPAFRAGRVDPNEALKEQGRTVAGERHGLLGKPLVVLQVALSLVLVVAAGLFVRTFATLARLDLGFDRQPLMIVHVDLQNTGVPQDQRLPLVLRLEAAARSVPGVAHAALSAITPVSGMGWNGAVAVPGGPTVTGREKVVWINGVTPGWFATYGMTLLAGRDFTASDRDGAPRVAIVNQAFAAKFMGKENPLGRTVRPEGFGPNDTSVPIQVVGLAANSAYRSPRDGTPAILYLPMAQADVKDEPQVALTVRSAGERPSQLVRSLATALTAVNRDVSLTFVPMTEQIAGMVVRERVVAMLSGFFGLLALVLAAVGLYGVTSYGVSRRRIEIGIRMALGADAPAISRLVLGQIAVLVSLGLIVGSVLSIWGSRFIGKLLYGLEPNDAVTFVSAIVLLAIVGTVAAWLPARRATRIDPMEVLREG